MRLGSCDADGVREVPSCEVIEPDMCGCHLTGKRRQRGGGHSALIGVDDRVRLAEAESTMRQRILREHMQAGVTIVDPARTAIEAGALTPLPATAFPLEEAAAAQDAVENGAVGKVVVTV